MAGLEGHSRTPGRPKERQPPQTLAQGAWPCRPLISDFQPPLLLFRPSPPRPLPDVPGCASSPGNATGALFCLVCLKQQSEGEADGKKAASGQRGEGQGRVLPSS